MSLKQNDIYYEYHHEMQAEDSRTEWIAFATAAKVGACAKVTDLHAIGLEELECLTDYLTAHIQDRYRRSHDQQHELLPDQPVF